MGEDPASAGPAGLAGPSGPASAGPAAGSAAGPDATFEEIMAELEAVTDRLASGELGIEAAADLYERAEHLHARATERLAQVQARVDRLAAGPDPPA